MENRSWAQALFEACLYTHDPELHCQSQQGMVLRFLWRWERYSFPIAPSREHDIDLERAYESCSVQEIFAILQRAVTEGKAEERIFALFLLGGLATSQARDLLFSFVRGLSRRERWASAIALGRLKEAGIFPLLQTFLLEGFADGEAYWAAQEACYLFDQARGKAENAEMLQRLDQSLKIYEWYLYQRSECALILGAWGDPLVIPLLQEALQAAWRMEQGWPDFRGPCESGPTTWYVFQDRLAFALGQLGAWDVLQLLPFPENHLLVARLYGILGDLQVKETGIFYEDSAYYLFDDSPTYLRSREGLQKAGLGVHPFIDPARIKLLLAERFGLSFAEQDAYVERFPWAWSARTKEVLPEQRMGDPISNEWLEYDEDLL